MSSTAPAVIESQAAEIAQSPLVQVSIGKGEEDELANWIVEEINKAKADRSGLESNILAWNKLYNAKPKVKEKTEPWVGAANLVVPVVATTVEAIHARLMNAVFGGDELYHCTGRSAKWVEITDEMGTWINWVSENVMRMYKVCQSWFLGMIKHGTSVLKMPWEKRVREVVYNDASGTEMHELIALFDGPLPQSVQLIDFFFSPDAVFTQDIQTCEWVSHRGKYTWKNLKEMEASEILFDVDRIKAQTRSNVEDVEKETAERTGIEVTEPNDYELFEFWCSYDLGKKGVPVELVVTIEPETRTILRAVYNFYRHQERPFHLLRYMIREDSLLGIGIPEMLEDIQIEITAIHNHRLDNATIANTRAWKRLRGSVIGDDEIYPGAFFDVDNMDDIQELVLGDVHPTLLIEEQHTNAIGEKRTGVSDYSVGRESSAIGSRATATSTLALIREGNIRFQMTIREIRQVLGDIAQQVIMLYQQFAKDSKVMYEMFSDEDGALVKQFMNLPPELSRANVLIDVAALSESNNKEIQQQTYLALMSTVQSIYSGLMDAFMIALAPQAPEQVKNLAIQGAETGSKLFERLLESFDIKDAGTMAPDIMALLNLGSHSEGGMVPSTGMNGVTAQAPPTEEILNAVNRNTGGPSPTDGASQSKQAVGSNPSGNGERPGQSQPRLANERGFRFD